MLGGKRIAVVMPAYNEERLVFRSLAAVPSFVDAIVVVDDASSDGTKDVVKRGPARRIHLVEHAKNRGVGAAVATGCKQALSLGADVTVVMAADGQMDPADLPTLLRPVLGGEADYVKGNRLDWPAARRDMPWQRWLGNQVFSWATRWATGIEVRDSQCGYTAINRRAKLALDWDGLWTGYGYPNDLLSWLSVRGLRVREVPVRPVYRDERSSIRVWDALAVIPFVIARAWLRARTRRRAVNVSRVRPA